MDENFFDIDRIKSMSANGRKSTNDNVGSPFQVEKAREIVSYRPGILIRWGNMIFLGTLTAIIVACWFIKYSDIVIAKGKLTSINAPKPVSSVIGGRIAKVLMHDSQFVRKGDVLTFIESTADHESVLQLSSRIDSIETLLKLNNLSTLVFIGPGKRLGDLQPYFQTFSQSLLSFQNYLKGGFYEKKIYMLSKDMDDLKKLHTNLTFQKTLFEEDLSLAQKTFNANETLMHNKAISDFDFRAEQSKLLNKKLGTAQITTAMVNNEIQQNEKTKEILELQNTISQKKAMFLQDLYTFKSQVDDWTRKYVLIAPIDGKIALQTLLQEGQQISANNPICFVNPGDSKYYVEVIIPQPNFGKVSNGQDVLLKFSSFPFQEFGLVKGKVTFISRISLEDGYLGKIELTDGLHTTNNREILYSEGLSADAEIITSELRLLQRFYFDLQKQLSR